MTTTTMATTSSEAAESVGGTAAVAIRINLVPRARQQRGELRRRVRRWRNIAAAYAAVVAVGLVFCYLRWGPVVRDLGGDLVKTTEQIDALRSARAKVQGELAEAQKTLDSAEALLGQPDWSRLMAILSDSLGDEVVLDSVRLELVVDRTVAVAATVQKTAAVPGEKPGGAAAAERAPNNKWVLKTGGYAKAPASVSHFVLRMEGLDLFDHVTLMKTNHEPFRSGEATSFQIECPLKGRGRIGR
jgi:hypothetical protein